MTRKITDQLTYVTIERNGVAHTYHKTPSPNTRLSTAWDLTLSKKNVKRISYASYVRLHTLMMQQFVSTKGTTSTCYYISRNVKPEPALTIVDRDQADMVSWWAM